MKPLALDLCCGLGGWAEGLIAAGWDVWGVDIDGRFEDSYPGTFWREDVCFITGQAVRDAMWMSCAQQTLGLVVASPPCQEFSRHDQPWTRKRNPPLPDTSIWEACVRIAAECGAPLILENVRGAQKFMGRAKAHYGSFYLWGDVPALLPKARSVGGRAPLSDLEMARKLHRRYEPSGKRGELRPDEIRGKETFSHNASKRAKIPFDLALHIGRVFHPGEERCA